MSIVRVLRGEFPGVYGNVSCVNLEESDGKHNPSGGSAAGVGFAISWQHGPRGITADGELNPATGAAVEDVLKACVVRLRFLQRGAFPSPYNEKAISSLKNAIDSLHARRGTRAERGVEGVNAE